MASKDAIEKQRKEIEFGFDEYWKDNEEYLRCKMTHPAAQYPWGDPLQEIAKDAFMHGGTAALRSVDRALGNSLNGRG